jgi:hypothetical protein
MFRFPPRLGCQLVLFVLEWQNETLTRQISAQKFRVLAIVFQTDIFQENFASRRVAFVKCHDKRTMSE